MKKCISIVLFSFLIAQVFAQDFAGGTGSSDDPYQIANVHQLQAMKNHLNSSFILINDIDATETATWNEVDGQYLGFEPIDGFWGSLFSNGYSIINLIINRPEEDNVGLFREDYYFDGNMDLINVFVVGRDNVGAFSGAGYVSGSIKVSGQIIGRDNVGGICGNSDSYSIQNCSVNGSITGNNNVGGLVGFSEYEAYFTGSNFKGEIVGSSNVGGIIGVCEGSWSINSSYVNANIIADSLIGGLIGSGCGHEGIEYSYFTGEITGKKYIGGLAGSNCSDIQFSYVEATIIADSIVGGLCGRININQSFSTSISNTYSSCKITANSRIGGLFGDHTGLPEINSNVYWNAEAAGVASWSGNEGTASNDKINPLTTSEMRQQASFEGWDFENTWAIKSGDSLSFPYLRNNTQVPAPGLYIPVISSRNYHLYSSSLSIYPQPMSEEHVMMDLSAFEATNYTVEIYDLKGVLSISKTVQGAQIAQLHLPELPSGLYNLLLKDATGQVLANSKVLK